MKKGTSFFIQQELKKKSAGRADINKRLPETSESLELEIKRNYKATKREAHNCQVNKSWLNSAKVSYLLIRMEFIVLT